MTRNVLLLERSLTVRMNLAEAFEKGGFRPLPCAALAEAQRVVASQAVDLGVIDVTQFDVDAPELVNELREMLGDQTPLLLLTSTPPHANDSALELWLHKHCEAEELLEHARRVLDESTPSNQTGPLLLLIDDSLTFRTEMVRVLKQHGFAVQTAATGEAGLKMLTQVRPEAVIVDGVLPGIDGPTVIRRLRMDAALRGIPCILLTAAQDLQAELRALDSGADAFARKDEDAEVLIARVQAVMRTNPSSAGESEAPLPAPKRILAVDDSATYRHRLAEALEEEGYVVLQASSGEEALELLSRESVDCILLDLMMPGMGGKETCRRLKSSPVVRNIPVMLLTGVEERGAMLDGLAMGADDYIPKSAEFEILKARVRVQLRRQQFESETRRVREQLLRGEMEAAEARSARELAHTRALLVQELETKNSALAGAYEQLKETQSQLIQSAKMASLGGLVAGVAHEINNPLSFVISHLETIGRCLQRLPSEAGEPFTDHHLQQKARATARLHETTLGVERIRDLVIKLRTFSRLDEGERKVVSFSECVGSLLTMLAHRLEGRIQVLTQLNPPDALDCYPSLLNQALMNLLSNAIDAIDGNGSIHITSGQVENDFVIDIVDTGSGIAEAVRERVFDPFFTTKPVGQGTGLGLSITYAIVRRHRGTLALLPVEGGGTRARLTLPLGDFNGV